jgi:hypothetical protein
MNIAPSGRSHASTAHHVDNSGKTEVQTLQWVICNGFKQPRNADVATRSEHFKLLKDSVTSSNTQIIIIIIIII